MHRALCPQREASLLRKEAKRANKNYRTLHAVANQRLPSYNARRGVTLCNSLCSTSKTQSGNILNTTENH